MQNESLCVFRSFSANYCYIYSFYFTARLSVFTSTEKTKKGEKNKKLLRVCSQLIQTTLNEYDWHGRQSVTE